MEVIQLGNIYLASMSIKRKRNKTVAVCSQRELTHFLSLRVFFSRALRSGQGLKVGRRASDRNKTI